MLLDTIQSPADLRNLPLEKLPALAQEVRGRLVEVVANTGGHLASSLGATELIIALHYCLNTPLDKIVFDVGHQSYAHKILTGRNKEFATLRQYRGISGFPSKNESEYDIFTAGHSSNAVSVALGLAAGRDLIKEAPFKVVAVVGDGSLSGGLCFEGLNNAGHLKKDILVVLNTNELSISPNVGAISTYLNKIISLPAYNRFKDSLEDFVKSRMPKGSRILSLANKFEESLKGFFIPGMLFEELGFRYFGPFDGHNVNLLVNTLKNILPIKGPKILHVITQKGKGYAPAENDPVRFHGTGPFDVETGESLAKDKAASPKSYTEVFSEKLIALAAGDKKIVAITAAMPEGTGLDKFRDLYPDRFFDVGIAEGHAVCFAAGLAKTGLKPVVAVYSTFLQRSYDQLIEDVALQDASVIFAIDRAGIVGEDGVTHQGLFDISYMSSIPNMVVMAPKDSLELEAMLEFSVQLDRPVALRYPRASCPVPRAPTYPIDLGRAELLREGKDFAIIALGSMVMTCLEALLLLEKEGFSGKLINARFAKPLDGDMFKAVSEKAKYVFTAEEGIVSGGFGSAVEDAISRPVVKIGLPCEFIAHGKRELLLTNYGLTGQGIADKIKAVMQFRALV